jgi:DNA-binding NarL/FixJ family response regulator
MRSSVRTTNGREREAKEVPSGAPSGDRIQIVEDDSTVCDLVAEVLQRAGFQTETAQTGDEALDAVGARKPTLVLLNVRLPDMSGYTVCRALRDQRPDSMPIIFMSGERTEWFDRVGGLLLGADDYIVVPFVPDELVARVRTLLRRSDRPIREGPPRSNLTARESEVLRLLADGLSQADIAGRLFISSKTVATHIEHILEKLEVRSRAQAVAFAYREGLLAAPPT